MQNTSMKDEEIGQGYSHSQPQHAYSAKLNAAHKNKKFRISMARTSGEIREAQRLRWKVFVEEMGARLSIVERGFDIDIYDAWCEHILLRDDESGKVVGTYRLLSPGAAQRIGSFHADQEFHLTRLGNLRKHMVEMGRFCVHPKYRSDVVISRLWASVVEFMQENGYEYLLGCACIGMQDGGHNAASVWHAIKASHLAPIEWQVVPRYALPLEQLSQEVAPIVPPMVDDYLNLGAYVCGEPAWDPDFNTADLLMLLPMQNLQSRQASHHLNARLD